MRKITLSSASIAAGMAIWMPLNASAADNDINPAQVFTAQPNPIYAYLQKQYQYSFDSWGNIHAPYPTNAWFTTLAVSSNVLNCPNPFDPATKDIPVPCQKIQPPPPETCFQQAWCINRFVVDKEGIMNIYPGIQVPAVSYPYYIGKSLGGGLKVGFPDNHSYSTETTGKDKDKVFAVLWPVNMHVEMGADEIRRLPSEEHFYKVVNYTPLSMTLRMQAKREDNNNYADAYLVRGAPYISVKYHQMTPEISFSVGINSVNNIAPVAPIEPAAEYKIIDANNRLWKIYFSHDVQLQWALVNGVNGTLVVKDPDPTKKNEPYTGWVRLALVNNNQNLKASENTDLLDQYSAVIPTGGSVSYSNDQHTVQQTFKWTTENINNKTNANSKLLMTALPHQQKAFNAEIKSHLLSDFKMPSNKGALIGVTGNEWVMNYKAPVISSPQNDFMEISSPDLLTDTQYKAIKTALEEDKNLNFHPNLDPYTFGKEASKFARLAFIADFLSQRKGISPEDKQSLQITTKLLIKKLELELMPWILGENQDQLFYDTIWGGIVPKQDDYGALSIYNDHHFHYGYIIYAFAAIAKFDPAWMNAPVVNTDKSKSVLPILWAKTLLRDYGAQAEDKYFPRLRTFDDYDGHSWASGLAVFGDGKNQESVSESVNAYYAMTIFGQVIKDPIIENTGKELLAVELNGAHSYYQITPGETNIYDTKYSHYTVTNLFNSKIDFHTWFGGQEISATSYGIEMLPFTGITPQLLKPWIENPTVNTEIQVVMNYHDGDKPGLNFASDPWKMLLLKGIAMGDTDNNAKWWGMIMDKNDSYDNGDSKTNTLFSIAANQSLGK